MIPVKYFAPTKPLLVSVEFHGDRKTVTKLTLATLGCGDIAGLKTGVCL